MKQTINQPFMKYENNVIYLSAGSEWVPISNIVQRIEKLEKQVAYLVNRIQK